MVSFIQGFAQLLSKKPKFQRQLKKNTTPKQRDTFNLLIGLPKETKTAVKKQQKASTSTRAPTRRATPTPTPTKRTISRTQRVGSRGKRGARGASKGKKFSTKR